MPAKKKSVGQHKLSGTYQPCRHQERAEKATATGEREVPDWLPAKAKAVYAELMQELPPLSSNDAITLAQVAILKAELMESPAKFTPSKHTQLRHLCATVREWIDDYQSMQPAKEKDDYEIWQKKRERIRAEQEAMTPEERAEKNRQMMAELTSRPIPHPTAII